MFLIGFKPDWEVTIYKNLIWIILPLFPVILYVSIKWVREYFIIEKHYLLYASIGMVLSPFIGILMIEVFHDKGSADIIHTLKNGYLLGLSFISTGLVIVGRQKYLDRIANYNFKSKIITTIALDLEGTLISNAISQFVRPGLNDFLSFCHFYFKRVVVYTAVDERIFRQIARQLVLEKAAPEWFEFIPHYKLPGEFKDVTIIPGAELKKTLLIDDLERYVHPDQKSQWIKIEPFESPYSLNDKELERVQTILKTYLQD